MAKLKEASVLSVIATLIGIVASAFAAYQYVEKNYTHLEKHQALASEVQKAAVNLEEFRIMNQLQWFQHQYRTQCPPPQQHTENCRWIADQIANLTLQLQEIRK